MAIPIVIAARAGTTLAKIRQARQAAQAAKAVKAAKAAKAAKAGSVAGRAGTVATTGLSVAPALFSGAMTARGKMKTMIGAVFGFILLLMLLM